MLNESTIKVHKNGETLIGLSPIENEVKCYCMKSASANTLGNDTATENIKIVHTTGDGMTVVMSQRAVTEALDDVETRISNNIDITTDDIDAICGVTIQVAGDEGVVF